MVSQIALPDTALAGRRLTPYTRPLSRNASPDLLERVKRSLSVLHDKRRSRESLEEADTEPGLVRRARNYEKKAQRAADAALQAWAMMHCPVRIGNRVLAPDYFQAGMPGKVIKFAGQGDCELPRFSPKIVLTVEFDHEPTPGMGTKVISVDLCNCRRLPYV